MRSNREIVERYTDAHVRQNWDELQRLIHPDFILDYPQSGERIRGASNFKAILENYPGGLQEGSVSPRRTVGSEDRWVMTPNFTLARLVGEGDTFTYQGQIHYSNGETWDVVSIVEIRDGKIWRETDYFAPPFEAPEWRSQWVERVEEVAK